MATDGWRGLLLRGAIIAAVVLWIYSPVCRRLQPADWLGDDDLLLTANLTVQHRLSPDPTVPKAHLATLAKLWFSPDGPDYFPLTATVLWAQWPFFRWTPGPAGLCNQAARRWPGLRGITSRPWLCTPWPRSSSGGCSRP